MTDALSFPVWVCVQLEKVSKKGTGTYGHQTRRSKTSVFIDIPSMWITARELERLQPTCFDRCLVFQQTTISKKNEQIMPASRQNGTQFTRCSTPQSTCRKACLVRFSSEPLQKSLDPWYKVNPAVVPVHALYPWWNENEPYISQWSQTSSIVYFCWWKFIFKKKKRVEDIFFFKENSFKISLNPFFLVWLTLH